MKKFKALKNLLLFVVILAMVAGSMAGCVVKEKATGSNEITTTTAEEATKEQTQKNQEATAKKDDIPAYINATGFPITKEKVALKLMGSKSPLHG